jgi:hypothetical protein
VTDKLKQILQERLDTVPPEKLGKLRDKMREVTDHPDVAFSVGYGNGIRHGFKACHDEIMPLVVKLVYELRGANNHIMYTSDLSQSTVDVITNQIVDALKKTEDKLGVI